MTNKEKAYVIGFCSKCVDRENAERFLTTNETQWMMLALFCRECAHYEVDIEVNYAPDML